MAKMFGRNCIQKQALHELYFLIDELQKGERTASAFVCMSGINQFMRLFFQFMLAVVCIGAE